METGEVSLPDSFEDTVLQINKNEPSEQFAKDYLEQADLFLTQIKDLFAREKETV